VSAADGSPIEVALAFGGNLGAVEDAIQEALELLSPSVTRLRVASPYRGPAVSPIAQPDFLNTAAVGFTVLPAATLLALVKELEWRAGRRPGARDGPRPLDIDLLLYDGLVLETPELTLPHPRLAMRRFVLEPLAELAPDLRVPPRGERVGDLLAALGPPTDADRLERLAWHGTDRRRRDAP
jgi:2-amino-4-hydroxy-6-hydroxymethyldihydropteridine diphosphokinase